MKKHAIIKISLGSGIPDSPNCLPRVIHLTEKRWEGSVALAVQLANRLWYETLDELSMLVRCCRLSKAEEEEQRFFVQSNNHHYIRVWLQEV